jgi:hypothetical protein
MGGIMTKQFAVPFIVFNLMNNKDTYAVDATLEHLDLGDLQINFMYMVQGNWYCDMLSTVSWDYARKKVFELFTLVDTSILCTVFMGEIHDQTIGNVDDFNVDNDEPPTQDIV